MYAGLRLRLFGTSLAPWTQGIYFLHWDAIVLSSSSNNNDDDGGHAGDGDDDGDGNGDGEEKPNSINHNSRSTAPWRRYW